MENSFQTSFIPKKPIVANSSVSNTPKTTSISMVVSLFILAVMLLSSGGLYLYKDYLIKNKAALSESLKKVKESFDKDTIAELEAYDKTTSVAKQILSEHIVLSPLFEKINELTLSSIQYTAFNHATKNNIFSVRMSGIAKDYKSIALQADVFSSDKGHMFQNVVFSNLTKDKNNFVTFDVEFDVDPLLLSYSNNIINGSYKKEVATPTVNNQQAETSQQPTQPTNVTTPTAQPTTVTTTPTTTTPTGPLAPTNQQ